MKRIAEFLYQQKKTPFTGFKRELLEDSKYCEADEFPDGTADGHGQPHHGEGPRQFGAVLSNGGIRYEFRFKGRCSLLYVQGEYANPLESIQLEFIMKLVVLFAGINGHSSDSLSSSFQIHGKN